MMAKRRRPVLPTVSNTAKACFPIILGVLTCLFWSATANATIPCKYAPTFADEFQIFSASEKRYAIVSGTFSNKVETSVERELIEDGLFKGTAEGTLTFRGHLASKEGFNTPISKTVKYFEWFDDGVLAGASAPVGRAGVYFLGVPDDGLWTFHPSSFYACETRSLKVQRDQALKCLSTPDMCGAED